MNKRIRVKKPSLVAKYTEMAIEKISEMGAGEGIYAYRGQGNAIWDVESAAYRRIKNTLETPPDMEMFIHHHETRLLEPARMNGYGFKDGRILNDLELLADLQHHAAATCLIDFTCNFLVALWFSCTDSVNSDGKLFIMNINDPNVFLSPEQGDLECPIRKILTFKTRNENSEDSFTPELKSVKYWHWSPHGINQRILKQDGLFIFGKMSIANDENLQYITIDQADKSELANELRVWGISREALFKDLPGFASSHAVSVPIQIWSMSADELIRAGNAATQKGEMEKAIQLYDETESRGGAPNSDLFVSRGIANYLMKKYDSSLTDYTKAIKINPDNCNAYLFRGFTNYTMENYDSSINDFTKAEEFEKTKYLALFYRGNSNSRMERYNDAILDYTKAIEFDPKNSRAYFSYLHRGIANASLENHEYAIIDYTRAIEIDPTNFHAYYNRGVANDSLDKHDFAIKDYTKTVELDPTNSNAYFNRGRIYAKMENHNAAAESFTNAIEHDPTDSMSYYARAMSYHELGRVGESKNSLARALELADQQKNNDLVQKIQNVLNHLNEDNQGV